VPTELAISSTVCAVARKARLALLATPPAPRLALDEENVFLLGMCRLVSVLLVSLVLIAKLRCARPKLATETEFVTCRPENVFATLVGRAQIAVNDLLARIATTEIVISFLMSKTLFAIAERAGMESIAINNPRNKFPFCQLRLVPPVALF